MIAETMRADIPVIPQRRREETPKIATQATGPRRRYTPPAPMAARSLLGLASLPTIVAIGPVDQLVQAHQLAAAFTLVQRSCRAQLVLLGAGAQRDATRRAVPFSARPRVHTFDQPSARLWSDVVAAGDVVVLGIASGSGTLLNVLAAGRPVVAPADPATVGLVVPASAGLVYQPGDVAGMTAAISRILTTPSLRDGMATRARKVAQRHRLQRAGRCSEGNGYV